MKVLSLLAASSSAQFSDYNTNYGDYGLAGRRFAGSKDLTQYADWTGSPRSCSPNQGPILKQFRCYLMNSCIFSENSLASSKIDLKANAWIQKNVFSQSTIWKCILLSEIEEIQFKRNTKLDACQDSHLTWKGDKLQQSLAIDRRMI